MAADGWSTVGPEKSRPQQSRQVDDSLSKFGKVDLGKKAGPFHLGPPGGATWGGGAGAAKEEEKTKAPVNMFSVLENTERKKSVDNGRASPTPETTPDTPAPGPVKLTKASAEKKMDGAVAEWFNLFDVNEFELTHKELNGHEYDQEFISKVYNAALEKKPDAVEKTGDLIVFMLQNGNFLEADVKESLTQLVSALDDISLDIPGAYPFTGVFIGRLMFNDSATFSWSWALTLLEPIIASKSRNPPAVDVLASMIKTVVTSDGEEAAVSMIGDQDLKLFWPEGRREEEELKTWAEKKGLLRVIEASVAA
ncbi:hypothetical protein HK101_003576 [Irineochytrium annulatum]|nr:hypothetical protein HK101_003576 [Irineochytrium annulatum]